MTGRPQAGMGPYFGKRCVLALAGLAFASLLVVRPATTTGRLTDIANRIPWSNPTVSKRQIAPWRSPVNITSETLPHARLIHIPKTAGTAIQKVLKNSGMRRCYWQKIGREKCTAEHTPPHWIERNRTAHRCYDGVPTFTVMRHPYDRAMSEYGFRCWANKTILRGAGYIIDEGPNGMRECMSNRTQMNMWLQWAAPRMSIQGLANHMGLDCHFLPQHVYAEAADFVFCNLTSAIEFMRNKMKMPQERLKTLKTDRQESNRKGRGHDFLDNETITILNQVYAKDFDLCGYEQIKDEQIE